MSLFASVALFKRGGAIRFKAPRKEASSHLTQARKAASRYWGGQIQEPDKLTTIIVVEIVGQLALVSERAANRRNWIHYYTDIQKAQPHLAACMQELGFNAQATPPALPETIEINGAIYRREI